MKTPSSRARRLTTRIEELERRHPDGGEPPHTVILVPLTDDGCTYRHDGVTVTREPDETKGDFYHRACSTFGVDSMIGLIAFKPEDVPCDADGRIDAPACSDEVLHELMDAKRRADSFAETTPGNSGKQRATAHNERK